MVSLRVFKPMVVCLCLLLLFVGYLSAQETTGGIVGTVKDPSGASVPDATVTVTASSLVGTKTVQTDSSGYYRFANLPPGSYTLTVTATGFSTDRRTFVLEVGHLPTFDITLEVGKTTSVIEVTGAAPQIDTTTNVTTTNVTEDVIQNVPHGRSFQSVIQFAPAARNEPLMGNNSAGGFGGNGTGGSSPGSTANGGNFGFSVAGGSDSENSYLVEGQETANLIGGYSHTSVPFDFIQEVEIKNSGIQAEHGGALGGVVNVIMRKGSNNYHGSVFAQFENDAMDANQQPTFARYNPLSNQTVTSWGVLDPQFQEYQPKKDHTSDIFPGFTFGGPILRDRIFFFVGFNPELNNDERAVNYDQPGGLGGLGLVKFAQNTRTYYTTARVDAEVTKKLRVYGSWLYQLQKQYGENLPTSDSSQGYFNAASTVDPAAYSHNVGFTAPNITVNTGADYSLTQRLILTGRFGYYFENYHDFGLPTTGTLTSWQSNGVGALDNLGNPLPSTLQEANGFFNLANSQNFTSHNASKASQADVNLAWFKSGWLGTHNFKFGYQLNHLTNNIAQHYNVPLVQYFVGQGSTYTPFSPSGIANCSSFIALYGACTGQYGYINVLDYGSGGTATSNNHSFFAQDSWSITRRLTINAGIRVEKEALPAENQPAGGITHPIDFGWGDKIAPRIGIAWDPTGKGKMKVFGGYGEFYDQMKLNLAISSFGGQYWSNCYYALNTPDVASINPVFSSTNRYCGGIGTTAASEANFGGTTPAGITFLENQNFRTNPTTCSTCTLTEEGVAPGLKPYKQHEFTVGFDYQIKPTLAFEVRYDRRRLDHVIEDSALVNPNIGETFVIVNPGQGVDATYDKFYNFLYGLTPGQPGASPCGAQCPNMIPAQRDYDGVEFRLTKQATRHWTSMFSYTYSRLWGNYTGLTSSDEADGGGGRNSPNNSRSFDEPQFSWNDNGGSSSGLLPTDRPNTFKGYSYYSLSWAHRFVTDFGIFQVLYQGSPESSYMDVGNAFAGGLTGGAFPTYVANRGKFLPVSQDPTTGQITIGPAVTQRTPWYIQTDFNVQQSYKISETKAVSFTATVQNLLNRRSVTSVEENITSGFAPNYAAPFPLAAGGVGCRANQSGPPSLSLACNTSDGTPFYAASFHPYNISGLLNNASISNATGGPATVGSGYGLPNRYQLGRTIRLGVKFTF